MANKYTSSTVDKLPLRLKSFHSPEAKERLERNNRKAWEEKLKEESLLQWQTTETEKEKR